MKTCLVTFVLWGLNALIAFSQNPTIASFTPHSSAAAMLVSISGNHFSTSPETNVYFASAKAIVHSGTTTSLLVEVPNSTTNSSATAAESAPSFTPRSSPIKRGDINRDGRPEVILDGDNFMQAADHAVDMPFATPKDFNAQVTTVCEGGNTTFSVTAEGDQLSYQWQIDTGLGFVDLQDDGEHAGTNTSDLFITNIPVSFGAHIYRCKVSSPSSADTFSDSFSFIIMAKPRIIAQPPSDITICQNFGLTFALFATGSDLTYRWQIDRGTGIFSDLSQGGAFIGVFGPVFTLNLSATTENMDGFRFRCNVSGNSVCGPGVLSNVVTLHVNTAPSITAQPVDNTVVQGQTADFTLIAVGTGSFSYLWQEDRGTGFANLADGPAYTGTSTPHLSIFSTTPEMNGYRYRCIVGGTCGQTTSNTVLLTVQSSLSILDDPESISICNGLNAVFSITAEGTGIVYQWQENRGVEFLDLISNSTYSGVNTPSLLIQNANTTMNGYQYRCVVTGAAGAVAISATATLTVKFPATIDLQPLNQTFCKGDNTSFQITASGAGNLVYQWQVNESSGFTDLTNTPPYSDVNTPYLKITNTSLSLAGYQYRCIVNGGCDPQPISNSAMLIAESTPPAVITQNLTVFLSPGGTVDVLPEEVDNGSTASCAIGNLSLDKTTFYCEDLGENIIILSVTDINGNTASEPATVTVLNAAPQISSIEVPSVPQPLTSNISISVVFTGNNVTTGSISWGDGTASFGTLSGNRMTGSHLYSTPGVYPIEALITNVCGVTAKITHEYLVVYNPSGGFVTGAGWFHSLPGAYLLDLNASGRANFGFVSKYRKDSPVPEGVTSFQFHAGNLNFTSTRYEWLVVTNYKAFYKGEGAVNGEPGYHFIISMIDGAKKSPSVPDKFRIKIWDASKNAVYDNQFGAADGVEATTNIAGGNIIIHDGNAKNSALARTETNLLSENTLKPTMIATAFPNPFTDHFSFEFNSKETTALKVQLINSIGQLIYNAERSYREDHTYEIELDSRPQIGVYILRVEQGSIVAGIKLVSN